MKGQKFSNIDFLRGLSALAVLVWHYQHFYFPEAAVNPFSNSSIDRSVQPMYTSLVSLYLYGGWAVWFFWVLSGFVFFHTYSQRSETVFADFFRSRFARLYPLHLITLIIVALLQLLSFSLLGHYQIYKENDLYHFVLHLFMASYWGFEKGHSFNAPMWSVSVEVLVYFMFFAFYKAFGIKPITSIFWFVWCWIFYHYSSTYIFECAVFFSLGGLVWAANEVFGKYHHMVVSIILAFLLSLLAQLLAFVNILTIEQSVKWLLFPAAIWLLNSIELRGLSLGKLGILVGSITYSSYLVHIPIQISILTFIDYVIGRRDIVNSCMFLLFYIVIVVVVSVLIYKYVEKPLQRYTDEKLLQRQKVFAYSGKVGK